MKRALQEKRALIFANGEQIHLAAVRALVRPEDFKVAADGGLRYLRRLDFQPDLVIGDLDSLEPGEIDRLRDDHVRVEKHPVDKDETDLELAIGATLREGCTDLLIVGALGGRLDMTLANIFLLALPELAAIDARLEDGLEEVFLIRPDVGTSQEAGARGTAQARSPGRVIDGRPGDRVSLLPLGGPARGIHTSGLVYPLRGETLYPERTRGVSNRMAADQAWVSLGEGLLICIHTRQKQGMGHEQEVGHG
jgi:thiamine pyrophosphokinase